MIPRLTSKDREKLYDTCRGEREFPPCAICGLEIHPGQDWDKSHDKHLPKALGGKVDGIAHRRCNREHNNRVDTPRIAKAKRQRQKHIGAHRSASRPIPGSRASGIRRRMNGQVERW